MNICSIETDEKIIVNCRDCGTLLNFLKNNIYMKLYTRINQSYGSPSYTEVICQCRCLNCHMALKILKNSPVQPPLCSKCGKQTFYIGQSDIPDTYYFSCKFCKKKYEVFVKELKNEFIKEK